MRRTWVILLVLIFVMGMAGCKSAVPASAEVSATPTPTPSGTPSPTPTPTPTPTPSPTPEPTPDLSHLAPDPLTGNLIDKAVAARRPFSIVINNMKKALPQSGLSQAGMYHEVLAESDITRIIAVFSDFSSEKIGPVRSTRDYFIDFGLDHDAIFIHHGRSPGAIKALRELKINNIDGMDYDGTVFQRDPVRVKQSGMYEHSSYTAVSRLLAQSEKLGYRMETNADIAPLFDFYEKPTMLGGQKALTVTVPFAKTFTPRFEFDPQTGLYSRFEYGAEQIDEETGEQLTVTNVVIQFAKMWVIPNDPEGRRAVELITEGDGLLITNGQYMPIKWKKTGHFSATQWFDQNGNKLKVNKGKTWICVINTGIEVVFE